MLISEVISINVVKRQERKRRVPSTPIADQPKRERVIRKLTKMLTRQSNLPQPTQADINTAIERFKTNQKRVDLEYEKQAKLMQQRQRNH
jgi:ribosomal protein L1